MQWVLPQHSFRAGQLRPEDAAALNALQEILARVTQFASAPPTPPILRSTFGNYYLADIYPTFIAKITGTGTDGNGHPVYAWTEQRPAVRGAWVDKEYGHTGTTTQDPAYGLNFEGSVPNGTIVLMGWGYVDVANSSQQYWFIPLPLSAARTITVVTNVCPIIGT